MKQVGIEDTIQCELYNGCVVSDIIDEPGAIFSLIKYCKLDFDDEVLQKARITKTIRDVKYRTS